MFCVFFFFKQKTAYEGRIRDWSSDVCSSDLQMNAAMQLKMTMSRRVNLADGRSRERGGARCSRPEPVAAHSRQERLATTSRAFGRCKRCSAAARPTEHAGSDLVRVWA